MRLQNILGLSFNSGEEEVGGDTRLSRVISLFLPMLILCSPHGYHQLQPLNPYFEAQGQAPLACGESGTEI